MLPSSDFVSYEADAEKLTRWKYEYEDEHEEEDSDEDADESSRGRPFLQF